MAAPRARWPKPLDTPKSEWLGIYGLPIPATANTLPEPGSPTEAKVAITAWEYGEMAEILHVGPYSEETPTIQKLLDFIKQQGYVIVGSHEEEYLRSAGMGDKGDPAQYYTIIRYRVKKG